MYIMIRTIAMTMRKGWKDTCDVDGQGSFPLLKGCGLSTVASVCKVVWQATATSMSWCLWHAWCVTHIWTCPEVTWLTLPTCYKVSRKQNAVSVYDYEQGSAELRLNIILTECPFITWFLGLILLAFAYPVFPVFAHLVRVCAACI